MMMVHEDYNGAEEFLSPTDMVAIIVSQHNVSVVMVL